MQANYSPKTFQFDHIIRDINGSPIGRVVMKDDSSYEEGSDIEIALFKVPLQFKDYILGLEVFVDGYRYKVPEKLPDFRINKREKDWVASSFILSRVQ